MHFKQRVEHLLLLSHHRLINTEVLLLTNMDRHLPINIEALLLINIDRLQLITIGRRLHIEIL